MTERPTLDVDLRRSSTDGGAAGCRAIDLRRLDGIDVRILPDRGFDLGAAWFRGTPLAWISAVGEAATAAAPARNAEWNDAFGGGLSRRAGCATSARRPEGHRLHGTVLAPARAGRLRRARDRTRWSRGRASSTRPRSATASRSSASSAPGSATDASRVTDVTREPRPGARGRAAALPRQPRASALERGRAARDRRRRGRRRATRTRRRPSRLGSRARTRAGRAGARLRARRRHRAPPSPTTACASSSPGASRACGSGCTRPTACSGLEPANCSVLGRAHDRAEGRLPGARARARSA